MKIALLTFLNVANYGANLQADSTYQYLVNHGHDVWAIDYQSYKTIIEHKLSHAKRNLLHQPLPVQYIAHHEFVQKEITNRTRRLSTTSEVAKFIIRKNFDAVIIGSDAVVQHWPWFSTLKLGYKRPFWIEPMQRERRFPNPFWGEDYADEVPTAMMSVSSQNSKYYTFSKRTLHHMGEQLKKMRYISTRDNWTRDMFLKAAPGLDVHVTPDPVFALNQNLSGKIPSETVIRKKYNLPQNYILIGLREQVFSVDELQELNNLFMKDNKECVAFDIEGRYNYLHPFKYQVPLPLSPLNWFALIKYASGYIGSNMHPIVSSLTNAVPCFSIDNWGIKDDKSEMKTSSKVFDVLSQYGLTDFWSPLKNGKCGKTVREIHDILTRYPQGSVAEISKKRLYVYNEMMANIIVGFKN
jgi:hypothetical protein